MHRLLHHPRIRPHLERGWKFAVAGGLGAFADFSLLNLFSWAGGMDPRLANVFSTLIASAIVFLINKLFAFRNRKGAAAGQLVRFIVAYAIAYVLNVIFTAVFITVGMRLLPFPLVLISNVSKALAIGTVMFWNYFMLHKFVFRTKDREAIQEAAVV